MPSFSASEHAMTSAIMTAAAARPSEDVGRRAELEVRVGRERVNRRLRHVAAGARRGARDAIGDQPLAAK